MPLPGGPGASAHESAMAYHAPLAVEDVDVSPIIPRVAVAVRGGAVAPGGCRHVWNTSHSTLSHVCGRQAHGRASEESGKTDCGAERGGLDAAHGHPDARLGRL